MTAEYEFYLSIKGTPDEIRAVLDVLKIYESNERPAYISFVQMTVGDKMYYLCSSMRTIEDSEFDEIIANNTSLVIISASGPYGHFCEPDEVDIFREMAQVAPGATFDGGITGGTSYTDEHLRCRLRDGILHINTCTVSCDEPPEAYVDYFKCEIPYEEFVELFKMNTETFTEEAYEELIYELFVGEEIELSELEYDDIIDNFGDDCSLTEEEFDELTERLAEMCIIDFFTFREEGDFGDKYSYDYDPVRKCVVDGSRSGAVTIIEGDVNEQIRTYLRENGMHCDDEAIAALSIEDTYAILAGTYVGAAAAQEAAAAEGETEEAEPAPEQPSAEEPDASEVPCTDKDSAEADSVAAAEPSVEPAALPSCPDAEETVDAASEAPEAPEATAAAESSAESSAEPAADSCSTKPAKAGAGNAWIFWLIVALLAAGFLAAYTCLEPVSDAVNSFIGSLIPSAE